MNPEAYMQRIRSRCTECGDCLLWGGSMYVSSASPKVGSRSLRRVVWTMTKGEIPDGKVVASTCDRPNCIEHLGLVTKAAVLKRTIKRPDIHARRVAARSRLLPKKLDQSKAEAIRSSDKTQRALAEEFGIAQSLVYRIRRGAAWKAATRNPFAGLGARA